MLGEGCSAQLYGGCSEVADWGKPLALGPVWGRPTNKRRDVSTTLKAVNVFL